MTESEFATLLEEIRRGRPEGTSLDWKRQWPDLKTDAGKDELRKDVASLANSAAGAGILIYGLKDGSLFSAALPVDEAVLQQILQGITPIPHVDVYSLIIESTPLTVITVRSPFDRPYVARIASRNTVFIRQGSSIGTATRYDLDAFYSSRVASPVLEIDWHHRKPGASQFSKGESTRASALPLFEPAIRMDEIENRFIGELNDLRRSSAKEGYPTAEQLHTFAQAIPPFINSLSEPHNLRHWYSTRFDPHTNGTLFSIAFQNVGVRPATELEAVLELPEWIILVDKPPKGPPRGYVPPPLVPVRPQPRPKPRVDQTVPDLSALLRGPDLSLARYAAHLPIVRETSGSFLGKKNLSKVTFWADRLLHTQSVRARADILALALPTTPPAPRLVAINARVFCAEQESWHELTLQIALIERP